jgi:hypothetical protein
MNTTLVGFTEAKSKLMFYIDTANVRLIAKSDNKITTLLHTYTPGPQGPMAYEILESPEKAAQLVNAGRLGKDLLVS